MVGDGLDECRSRLRALLEALGAVIWEAHAHRDGVRYTFVHPYAEVLLGYPVERWLSEPGFCIDRLHAEDRAPVLALYRRLLGPAAGAGSRYGKIEYRMRAADGQDIWFLEVVERVRDQTNQCEALRGVMANISARKSIELRCAHLASHDGLTGLPNRQLLLDRLRQALIYAGHCNRATAVLLLDIDRFNLVNDSLGHGMGDRLLQAVAKRLRDCVPEVDILARLGGDAFVLVLEDLGCPQDAAVVAREILSGFSRPFLLEALGADDHIREFFFSLSVGISLYPDDGGDPHMLLKNADTAMHRVKEQGGDGFRFFTSEMDARARRRLGLETALRNALEREEFVLHYQPQVHAPTGKVIGVEALLRWNHPDQGLMGPDQFIPLLEETGLILPVGEWVLRTACIQQRAWRQSGVSGLRMAVNLSARQLRHDGLAKAVHVVLREAEMEPCELELEITESAVMAQFEHSLEALHQVRALGVRLSLDDFGTGYSSLSQLKVLPVNAVKIAQAFVRDIPGDKRDAAIARAIVTLTLNLGLQVIAEGVETPEQLRFLGAQGCDLIQGYYFSRPLPPAQIAPFIAGSGFEAL